MCDQEIDALVENSLLSAEELWNTECRKALHFTYPEMTLDVWTGSYYPVQPLNYKVTNLSFPRIVADQLIIALRHISTHDSEANTFNKWCKRELSTTGRYEFEMTVLHMVTKTATHLKRFRLDITYWKDQNVLSKTNYSFSLERRTRLLYYHGISLFSDDADDGYDPLDPDWSKKEADLTIEQKLALSEVQYQLEIKDSMFGIDLFTIQGHNLANSIFGKTPEEICAEIPESFRILHVESVMRSDLTSRFNKAQVRIKDDMEKFPLSILKGSAKLDTR